MRRYGAKSLEVLTRKRLDRQVDIGSLERIDSQSVESCFNAAYPDDGFEVTDVEAIDDRSVRTGPQRMYFRFKHIPSLDGRLAMKSSAKSPGRGGFLLFLQAATAQYRKSAGQQGQRADGARRVDFRRRNRTGVTWSAQAEPLQDRQTTEGRIRVHRAYTAYRQNENREELCRH
jgi:hypothetical protein